MEARQAASRPWLTWLGAVGVTCLAIAVVFWRLTPPPPSAAGDGAFEAKRALDASARVIGHEPHMVASLANQAVRKRLVKELGAPSPEIQRGMSCGRHGSCAYVENVIARLPGADPSRQILLVAHYDSVAAGVGAGDDGSGVGILLELKRLLQSAPLTHPVTLLFTDGEELGLLGAELFASKLPKDGAVRVAINVEARGSSGPSLLFDVSETDTALLERVAPALKRPFTSSLFPLVYRKLPNDTDLTALRRGGVPGLGFGFIGRVDHYHTTGDNHDNLSPASVQHQGESVLAATRALLLTQPLPPPSELGVFFDLLGLRILRLSTLTARALALASVLALAIALFRRRRRGQLTLSAALQGAFNSLLGLVLAGVGGLALQLSWARVGAPSGPFVAGQNLAYGTAVLLAFAATHTASLINVSVSGPGKLLGAAVVWVLGANLTAFLVPEATFLFLLPAAVAAIVTQFGKSESAHRAAAAAFTLTAVVLWAPLLYLLGDAIGLTSPLLLVMVCAVALTPLSAALHFSPNGKTGRLRMTLVAGLWGATAVCATSFALAEDYDAERRQRLNLALDVNADTEATRWLVNSSFGEPRANWAHAFGLSSNKVPSGLAFFGRAGACRTAPAEPLALPAPEWSLLEATRLAPGRVRLRIALRSRRGARALSVGFAAQQVESVHVNGVRASLRRTSDGRQLVVASPPGEPVVLELVVASRAFEMQLADHTAGFAGKTPPTGRPDWAVASQWGDTTVVHRTVRIGLASNPKSR